MKKITFVLQSHISSVSPMRSKSLLGGICLISFVAIFFAFQSRYNFFSEVISHPTTAIISPATIQGTTISLENTPSVVIQIPSVENNLGIISLSLTHFQQSKKQVSSFLQVLLQEKGSLTPVAIQSYGLDEFRGVDFPFGFPQIQNSKGKTYTMTLLLSPVIKGNYLTLDTTSIKSVYQPNKSEFVKNPRRLLSLFLSKLQYIVENGEARIISLLFFPFTLLSLFLIARKYSATAFK